MMTLYLLRSTPKCEVPNGIADVTLQVIGDKVG
jgi:hypothetical protein